MMELTPLNRRQRADFAEINAEEPIDPNDRNMWETEYKVTNSIGKPPSNPIQGGRKTRRRSPKRKTRKNRRKQ
jgi:hypothetical protein